MLESHAQIAKRPGTNTMSLDEERQAWLSHDYDSIIRAHIHLARRMGEEFARIWRFEADELASEAYIGLLKAVKKFEPEKGIRYHYYATFWIKACIFKFIINNWRLVKVGTTQNQRRLFFSLRKTIAELEAQGQTPTVEDLAAVLECSPQEITEMWQRLGGGDLSLSTPLIGGEDLELGDVIADDAAGPEEIVENEELSTVVQRLFEDFSRREKLTPKEIDVLTMRALSDDPATLQTIGDKYGVTRERIRQMEKYLLRRFKAYIRREAPDLADYFSNPNQ